ncbi:MAG: hypothetical protein QXG10_00460 [Candidatus Hadarchaeales archaeon]
MGGVLREGEPSVSEMPKLYDVFEPPKMKSVRAVTKMREQLDIREVFARVPKVQKITTSKKTVAKFHLRRSCYLLLFPTGYVEIHAPDEGSVREVMVSFRDELYKSGLL